MKKKTIQRTVVKMFPPKQYGKGFINELARLLIEYGMAFKIDTPDRLARFLAHVKAEVDTRRGEAAMRENMNYSAKRLKQVFRVMRHHQKWAEKYGRTKDHPANQRMIANIVYANRLGNRGVDSGDGWRYRGAGVMQSTGRKTIREDLKLVEEITGMTLIDPRTGDAYDGILDSYTVGILIGMAYWLRSGMADAKSFKKTIDIINYYTDSRAKRERLYAAAKKIIGDSAA